MPLLTLLPSTAVWYSVLLCDNADDVGGGGGGNDNYSEVMVVLVGPAVLMIIAIHPTT